MKKNNRIKTVLLLVALSVLNFRSRRNIEYLIVTSPSLIEAAVQVKDFHEPTMTVEIVEWINTDPEQGVIELDKFVDRFHSQNEALKYILILGSRSMIPSYEMVESFRVDPYTGGASDFWTDRPFAETQIGKKPIIIGRLPLRNRSQFQAYAENAYADNPSNPEDRSILFWGDDPEIDYARRRDIALAERLGFKTTLIVSGSEETILKHLQDPNLVASFYYGHGTWLMNGHLVSRTAFPQLTSSALYFSSGCGFGASTDEHVSVSESYITHVGQTAIGATENGGYGPDYDFVPHVLNGLNTAETVGELVFEALDKMPKETEQERGAQLRMTIFGDPALPL